MPTDVTPLVPEGRQIIESYGGERFTVSGVVYSGSVIVFPERTITWPVDDFAAIGPDALAPVMEAAPAVEVLLVGCGLRMQLLPAALRQDLRAHNIGCDVMDTGAACRTYNVLMAEGRRVAAALIALPR